MNYPVICEYCGSRKLRLSHRKSIYELFKMAIGTYAFRCLDCGGRFDVNVFLISRLAYAKCPRCLSLDVATVPRRDARLTLLRRLMLTFGAHPCRCKNCRYRFVSFRPAARIDKLAPATEGAADGAELPVESESNSHS